MLGFDPISQHPISDIELQPITGYISVTDQNDTATINANVLVNGVISATDQDDTATLNGGVLVTGSISTTDQNDTASINAQVLVNGTISVTDENDTASINGSVAITGYISVTDEDDTARIVGAVIPFDNVDTHDGFTKDEIKRYKKLQKKIAQAEAAKIQARLDKQQLRKQQIKDLVVPKPIAVDKQTEVESVSEVKIDKPSIDLKKLNATIINLERQKQELIQSVALRNEMARIQMEMAVLEAKRIRDELDDEEALLLLI